MKFEIKSKFTGKILFKLECASLKICLEKAINMRADLRGAYLRGADLRGADLRGTDLRGAYLRGAYLRGAYLRGADLRGADLRGAYLRGADLRGTDLRGADLRGADLRGTDLRGADLRRADLRGTDGKKIKIEKTPLQILGLYWDILIFDNHMKIGCEFHSIKDWSIYNDNRISKMDSHALTFWKESKEMIISFCKSNKRG